MAPQLKTPYPATLLEQMTAVMKAAKGRKRNVRLEAELVPGGFVHFSAKRPVTRSSAREAHNYLRIADVTRKAPAALRSLVSEVYS